MSQVKIFLLFLVPIFIFATTGIGKEKHRKGVGNEKDTPSALSEIVPSPPQSPKSGVNCSTSDCLTNPEKSKDKKKASEEEVLEEMPLVEEFEDSVPAPVPPNNQ